MKLIAVSVFNPTLTNKEERAHENIISYHPPDTPINQQMNEVGLCTALTGLIAKFSEEGSDASKFPTETITTAQRRYVITRLEGDFYCVVIVGRELVDGYKKKRLSSMLPKGRSQKGGVPQLEDDADDRWSSIVHRQTTLVFLTFHMMFGTLGGSWEKLKKVASTKMMRRKMSRLVFVGFVKKLLFTLTTTIDDYLMEGSVAFPGGIEYVPVTDGRSFMAVSCLMNEMLAAHPGAVSNALVLHRGKVLFSTLDVDDTSTVFHLMQQYSRLNENKSTDNKRGSGTSSIIAENGMLATSMAICDEPDDPEDPIDDRDLYSPTSMMRSEERRSSFFHLGQQKRAEYVGFGEELRTLSPPRGRTDNAANGRGEHTFPFIFVRGEPVGVVSYHMLGVVFMFMTNKKFLEHPQLREGLLTSIRGIMSSERYSLLAETLKPSMISSKGLDERYCYFYGNDTNGAVKTSIVSALSDTSSVGSLNVDGSSPQRTPTRGSFSAKLIERLSFSHSSTNTGGMNINQRALIRSDIQEALRRMDVLRAFVKPQHRSDAKTETLVSVSSNIWVYIARIAHREFLLIVEGSSLPQAIAQVDFVSKYVFVGLFTS